MIITFPRDVVYVVSTLSNSATLYPWTSFILPSWAENKPIWWEIKGVLLKAIYSNGLKKPGFWHVHITPANMKLHSRWCWLLKERTYTPAKSNIARQYWPILAFNESTEG